MKHQVTIIPGDGIGYEIMDGTLAVLKELTNKLTYDIVYAGLDVYNEKEYLVGDEVYASIEKNKVALKGPITTPIGSGFSSINVMLRKKYDLYCNLRILKSLPNIKTKFEDINLIIFRENTEDLYLGEETSFTTNGDEVAIALKRITRFKSYRIIKDAFEYAHLHNYDKVSVVHKANILKLSDGLFLKVAQEVALEYPHIKLEPIIIDNMCMQLVMYPQKYNVIVTMNLYGD
ncbi:MAG: isocitrate/isopropylmalate family dehydrogenase, partial [Bacilli bacterium]